MLAEQLILRVEERSATELKYHDIGPGKRYVFSDHRNNPSGKIYAIVRTVEDVSNEQPHVEPHVHDDDSLFLFIGDRADLTGLTVEVNTENDAYPLSSPASVYIPAGVPHAYRFVEGSGKFVNIVLAENCNYNEVTKMKRNKRKRLIELLDTTLREGEQTPGVSFSKDQKLEIARRLDQFGIDYIEAGHPFVSHEVFSAVSAIAHLSLRAEVLGHARAREEDIRTVEKTGCKWVGIFLGVNEYSLKYRLKNMSLAGALSRIESSVKYAKDRGLRVRYTIEDATRTEFAHLSKAANVAEKAGADRIGIADTVGIMTPERTGPFIERVMQETSLDLHVHCHNDLGLALANSLAAYLAGARVIDVTVNGLGERAGITDLSSLVVTLNQLYGEKGKGNWDLKTIPGISQLIQRCTGYFLYPTTPVTGPNVTLHKCGVHTASMQETAACYQPYDPEILGMEPRVLCEPKMIGKSTLTYFLGSLGLDFGEDDVEELLKSLKSEEHFVVYDRYNERASGVAPRSVVHENPRLVHRGVYVLLLNGDGEILLQRRGEKDLYPNRWTASAAGHVGIGETYEIAAFRESLEEIGVNPHGLEELGEIRVSNERETEIKRVFVLHHDSVGKLGTIDGVKGCVFFSRQEIENMIKEERDQFTPGFLQTYEELFSRNGVANGATQLSRASPA